MTPPDTTVATALAALSGYLDDPSIEIGSSFEHLTTAVRAAVPSFCGLSITLVADGVPVTITAPNNDDAGALSTPVHAVTSLVVPLSAISAASRGELVLFAAAAGAFVDLAADLAYLTATELVTFDLDTRLGPPEAVTVGVGGFSLIHQAIGMLLGSGYTREQARARIAEIAVQDGHDLAAAAEHVLNGDDQ